MSGLVPGSRSLSSRRELVKLELPNGTIFPFTFHWYCITLLAFDGCAENTKGSPLHPIESMVCNCKAGAGMFFTCMTISLEIAVPDVKQIAEGESIMVLQVTNRSKVRDYCSLIRNLFFRY